MGGYWTRRPKPVIRISLGAINSYFLFIFGFFYVLLLLACVYSQRKQFQFQLSHCNKDDVIRSTNLTSQTQYRFDRATHLSPRSLLRDFRTTRQHGPHRQMLLHHTYVKHDTVPPEDKPLLK